MSNTRPRGVEIDVTVGLKNGGPDFCLFRLTGAERDDLIACLRSAKECQKRALRQAQLPPDDDANPYRTIAHGRRLSKMPSESYVWDEWALAPPS